MSRSNTKRSSAAPPQDLDDPEDTDRNPADLDDEGREVEGVGQRNKDQERADKVQQGIAKLVRSELFCLQKEIGCEDEAHADETDNVENHGRPIEWPLRSVKKACAMSLLTLRVHSPTPDEVLRHLHPMLPEGVLVTGEPVTKKGPSALIAFSAPHDEEISHYEWIHIGGAGIDRIANALKGSARIPILTRTIGAMGRQMAEYVLGYILADLQKMRFRDGRQSEADWQKEASLPSYLFNRSVAIFGTGPIGKGVAEALTPLCREVTGYSRSGREAEGFTRTLPLERFGGADIVIAALPSTRETDGIVGKVLLERMNGSLFINIGRGAVLDDHALLRALESGAVRHAILDVFRQEPLPQDHPYWSHEAITVTPHVSGVTRPIDIAEAFAERLPKFLARRLTSEVDLARGY